MARRTVEQIVADADALADRFEQQGPDPATMRDSTSLRAVHQAFQRVAFAEHELAEAVAVARADSFSWALIGSMMGTTREAARQRYGRNADEASSDRPAPADTSTEARPVKGRLAG